jgi:hypothetical protein
MRYGAALRLESWGVSIAGAITNAARLGANYAQVTVAESQVLAGAPTRIQDAREIVSTARNRLKEALTQDEEALCSALSEVEGGAEQPPSRNYVPKSVTDPRLGGLSRSYGADVVQLIMNSAPPASGRCRRCCRSSRRRCRRWPRCTTRPSEGRRGWGWAGSSRCCRSSAPPASGRCRRC